MKIGLGTEPAQRVAQTQRLEYTHAIGTQLNPRANLGKPGRLLDQNMLDAELLQRHGEHRTADASADHDHFHRR